MLIKQMYQNQTDHLQISQKNVFARSYVINHFFVTLPKKHVDFIKTKVAIDGICSIRITVHFRDRKEKLLLVE